MADWNINKVKYSYFQKRNYYENWEINHPGLTCGLPQTCTIKAITFLLYFLRYSLPKHIRGIIKKGMLWIDNLLTTTKYC